jgi:hypothetical protein
LVENQDTSPFYVRNSAGNADFVGRGGDLRRGVQLAALPLLALVFWKAYPRAYLVLDLRKLAGGPRFTKIHGNNPVL